MYNIEKKRAEIQRDLDRLFIDGSPDNYFMDSNRQQMMRTVNSNLSHIGKACAIFKYIYILASLLCVCVSLSLSFSLLMFIDKE
jgi:hypothetical protein